MARRFLLLVALAACSSPATSSSSSQGDSPTPASQDDDGVGADGVGDAGGGTERDASPAPDGPPRSDPSDACGDAPVPASVTQAGAGLVVRCPRSGELPAVLGEGPSGEDLFVEAWDEGTVHLRYGAASKRPSFVVDAKVASPRARVGGTRDGAALLCAAALTVRVDPATCALEARDAAGAVLLSRAKRTAFFRGTASRSAGALPEPVRGVAWDLLPGERIYGLGLRTGEHLDRRGRVFEMWSTDAYDDAVKGFRLDADPLYETIPFHVGLRNGRAYGLYTDNTHRLRVDVGKTEPDVLRVTAFGGALDEYLFAGPGVADVLARYTRLVGRPALPPLWSLGYHQSRWDGPCDGTPKDKRFCSADQVRAVAAELRERRLPADAVWLDIQHMDGFRTFTFDPTRFADPAALARDLEKSGLHLVAIADPGLKVDGAYPTYARALREGVLLGAPGGGPFVGEVWPGPSVFPDFSHPGARRLWSDEVERVAKLGISGLWIDMNEPASFVGGTVPDDVVAHGEGAPTTMAEIHNVYALLEARASYEGLVAARPDVRPFLLSRAAFAGQQRYTGVWTGDAPSTWASLRQALPMLLGLGLSGMTFAGTDVPGYSGREETTPELFARWLSVGALSPFFRGHGEKDARRQEPWAFGPEAEAAARSAMELRYTLLPTLYSAFAEAAETGAPVLRPLVYEFQDDPATYDLASQALVGRSLLFAPITEPAAAQRTLYLPKGAWFDLVSGARMPGGGEVTLRPGAPFPLAAFPVLVREGAILARKVAPGSHVADATVPKTLLVDVYPGREPSSFTLYEDDGESFGYQRGVYAKTPLVSLPVATGTVLEAQARSGAYVPAARSWVVRFVRVEAAPTAVRFAGTPLRRVEAARDLAPETYAYDAEDHAVLVMVPDAPRFRIEVDHERLEGEAAPTVPIRVSVRLPKDTPKDATIALQASSSGWSPVPLARSSDGLSAEGTLSARRGDWVFFKVTRGGWSTVEKDAACSEIPNRVVLARPHGAVTADVLAWSDRCGRFPTP